jgi:hypothetical protein
LSAQRDSVNDLPYNIIGADDGRLDVTHFNEMGHDDRTIFELMRLVRKGELQFVVTPNRGTDVAARAGPSPQTHELSPIRYDDLPQLGQLGTTGGGGFAISVDTRSLKSFADGIEATLIPAIRKTISALDSVAVEPGGLPAGQDLRAATVRVKASYQQVLTKLQAGLVKLAGDMREVGAMFDRADAMNQATADDLKLVMGDLNELVTATGARPVASLDSATGPPETAAT